MESLPKMHHSHLSLNLSALKRPSKRRRSSLPSPLSPLSPIRDSLPKHHASHKPQNPLLQTLTPLVKPACLAIAATAFLLARLHSPSPAAAAALPVPSPESETLSNDADALRSLVEEKIRARKVGEAICVMDRLMKLEPEVLEYLLLRAHLHLRNGEHALAASVFEELLKKDPLHVEAYRGLLMVTLEMKKPTEELLKRIEEAVRVCEGDFHARDFKLLIAQIKVMDGDLSDALRVYEELVKEDPKDFRPYLCQGIVYTMLRKKDEAEKQFDKYRTLVPENHPYKQFFEDNTQLLGRGGVPAKT